MDREKSVDESWKEAASLEKEKLENIARGKKTPGPGAAPAGHGHSHADHPQAQQEPSNVYEADFVNYITSLAYQAMIFMGEIPNPVSQMPEKNLEQAKFVIETLIMLQEKTKGNLTKKEGDVLNTAAYELQMKYVEVTQKEAA